MDVASISYPEMAARLPEDARVLYTALVTRSGNRFLATIPDDARPFDRVQQSLAYLAELIARMTAAERDAVLRGPAREIIFQMADEGVDVPSIAYQADRDARNIRLIPDVCYHLARGYEGAFDDAPAWRDRIPAVIWRGSSTGTLPSGTLGVDVDSIVELPRYRLCREAARLGPVIDAKLSAIVQPRPPEQYDLILDRCTREGLMGAFLPWSDMARYRMLIDIDGNANSWNAMARYRMGCCILKVASPWLQWFDSRFRSWEHFVPVRADLSDLGDRIDWCLANDAEAGAIASRGRAEALSMRFDEEMAAAGRKLLSL